MKTDYLLNTFLVFASFMLLKVRTKAKTLSNFVIF